MTSRKRDRSRTREGKDGSVSSSSKKDRSASPAHRRPRVRGKVRQNQKPNNAPLPTIEQLEEMIASMKKPHIKELEPVISARGAPCKVLVFGELKPGSVTRATEEELKAKPFVPNNYIRSTGNKNDGNLGTDYFCGQRTFYIQGKEFIHKVVVNHGYVMSDAETMTVDGIEFKLD